MSEVRIWTRARSQAELQSTMNKPLVGNEPGLCVYRSRAEPDRDDSGRGAARVQPDLPTTRRASWSFDWHR